MWEFDVFDMGRRKAAFAAGDICCLFSWWWWWNPPPPLSPWIWTVERRDSTTLIYQKNKKKLHLLFLFLAVWPPREEAPRGPPHVFHRTPPQIGDWTEHSPTTTILRRCDATEICRSKGRLIIERDLACLLELLRTEYGRTIANWPPGISVGNSTIFCFQIVNYNCWFFWKRKGGGVQSVHIFCKRWILYHVWYAAAAAAALSIGRFFLGRSKKKSEKRRGNRERKELVGMTHTQKKKFLLGKTKRVGRPRHAIRQVTSSSFSSFTLPHINVVFLVFYPILDFFPLFHLLHQISFFQARFAIPWLPRIWRERNRQKSCYNIVFLPVSFLRW